MIPTNRHRAYGHSMWWQITWTTVHLMNAHKSNANIFIDMLWEIIIKIKWSTRINLFAICPATLLNSFYFPQSIIQQTAQSTGINSNTKRFLWCTTSCRFLNFNYFYSRKCHTCIHDIATNSTTSYCVHTQKLATALCFTYFLYSILIFYNWKKSTNSHLSGKQERITWLCVRVCV